MSDEKKINRLTKVNERLKGIINKLKPT